MARQKIRIPKHKFKVALFMLIILISAYSCKFSKKNLQAAKMNQENSKVFFDDFNYNNLKEFYANNWKARTVNGHPGIKGANWSSKGISFHQSVSDSSKKGIIRMTSFTDGTGKNTQHTQFCHQRKYLEGTYASRVYFRDKPTSGPDGDEIIQTFYTISPLKAPMDLDYSEADFEYLPNGGWGEGKESAMWSTTWETFQLEPWTKVNQYTRKQGSYNGWHILVLTIKDNRVKYYVDGELLSNHGGKVYPEVPMSINFNLWFMPKGADNSAGPIASKDNRVYQEDIDWVFHKVGVVMSTKQVKETVSKMRKNQIQYLDNVPEMNPPLDSPCGL